jgi:hypothetical protein
MLADLDHDGGERINLGESWQASPAATGRPGLGVRHVEVFFCLLSSSDLEEIIERAARGRLLD